MINQGGELLYKCRLCGAITPGCYVPDSGVGLLVAMGFRQTPREWGGTVTATRIHPCEDGRLGVSDIAGCQPVKGAE